MKIGDRVQILEEYLGNRRYNKYSSLDNYIWNKETSNHYNLNIINIQ